MGLVSDSVYECVVLPVFDDVSRPCTDVWFFPFEHVQRVLCRGSVVVTDVAVDSDRARADVAAVRFGFVREQRFAVLIGSGNELCFHGGTSCSGVLPVGNACV